MSGRLDGMIARRQVGLAGRVKACLAAVDRYARVAHGVGGVERGKRRGERLYDQALPSRTG